MLPLSPKSESVLASHQNSRSSSQEFAFESHPEFRSGPTEKIMGTSLFPLFSLYQNYSVALPIPLSDFNRLTLPTNSPTPCTRIRHTFPPFSRGRDLPSSTYSQNPARGCLQKIPRICRMHHQHSPCSPPAAVEYHLGTT